MRDAMSAVTTLASIAVALTSGAVSKRHESELLVDLALVLAIQRLPLQIAVGGDVGDVGGRAVGIGILFQANAQILGVVVAPIEAFGAAEPIVLGAAVETRFVRAQFEQRDLVGLGVAEQPFVGVQAVVLVAQILDHLVDVVAVLDGFARAISDGRAIAC